MKSVYEEIIEFKVEGKTKEWQSTSDWGNKFFLTKETVEKQSYSITIPSFKDLIAVVSTDLIPEASIQKTFFRKKLVVILRNNPQGTYYKMTEKNFKPVSICSRFEICDFSINILMKQLSADNFLEYCKDRNFFPKF